MQEDLKKIAEQVGKEIAERAPRRKLVGGPEYDKDRTRYELGQEADAWDEQEEITQQKETR